MFTSGGGVGGGAPIPPWVGLVFIAVIVYLLVLFFA